MAIPVKLKRSGTTTATPSSLEYGELAINYADGVVFYRDAADTIQSFTLQSYALASHTHAASDITSGTLDAARLPLATTGAVGGVIVGTGLGVSSGTVSVTYGTTAGTSCQGNDSRLSDTRTPTDGSVTTAKIVDSAVTYAKLQNVSATDRLLGRSSAGAGVVEEVTCTAFGRSLIDDADAAAARTTLGVQPTASPTFTGAATVTNDGNVVPLTVTNTGTANSFVVNDASGDTSPFVIDAAGNVGIGTSSPAALLSVAASGSPQSKIDGFETAQLRGSAVSYLRVSGGAVDTLVGSEEGGGTSFIGTFTNHPVVIRTNNEERLRITAGGQLLVTAGSGTGPSSYKPGIAVSGDDDTGIQQVGGANTISLVTNGAERMRIDASGNVLYGSQGSGAGVATPHYLQLGNQFASTAGDASKAKLRIFEDNAGNVVGMGVSNALTEFHTPPGAAFAWYVGNTERFRISSGGTVTAAQVYSDTVGATNRDLFIDDTGKLGYVSSIRASKTNIAAIDDVSWLRDLTPVSFHYRKRNEDGTYSDDPDGTLDYGLIAEEVEPVAPEMCCYDMVDGEPQLRGVHYSKLITPMLRYIQQLEARIAALEERLNHA